ncbi:MAG: hypothetical protein EZS28_032603 [Streblomastix strix]|uniref:Uncharacterized protein n=1 Tax=Streblomastix strix TaxID=222440 RepID=A0A5J4UP66_9EUKA|nr:MAG: hypothetical protein EZS28_032603 [Streblomastix strix]
MASVNTLLTRIVGFTGVLDQELKKLTAQQVTNMIRSKPEIMPPEWAQDLARNPIPETKLNAQPMQHPQQPVQFPVIPPPNPFLPSVNPPQTQISEP